MLNNSTAAKPANSSFSIDALMAINRPSAPNMNCSQHDCNRLCFPPIASSHLPAAVNDCLAAQQPHQQQQQQQPASPPPQPQPPRAVNRTANSKKTIVKASRRRNSSSSFVSSSSHTDNGGIMQQQHNDSKKPAAVAHTHHQLPPPQQQAGRSETPDTTTSDSGGANNNAIAAVEEKPAANRSAGGGGGGGKIVRSSTGSNNNGGGGGNGISPAQLNVGNSTCYELCGVQCHLEMKDLWVKFNELGTEMIITRSGRRMFPTIRVAFTGLDPKATYAIFMDIVPVDQKRYRYAYHKSSWLVAGKAEVTPLSRLYAHPDGPMSGEQLRKQVISFEKIKLTNFMCDKNGHVVLHSMHRYQPRIHLVVVDRCNNNSNNVYTLGGLGTSGSGGTATNTALAESLKNITSIQQLEQFDYKTCMFKETTFYSVTAYQNQLITKLKIDSNPFAKGFRDSTRIITDFDREPHSMMMSHMMMLGAAGAAGGLDPFRMAQLGMIPSQMPPFMTMMMPPCGFPPGMPPNYYPPTSSLSQPQFGTVLSGNPPISSSSLNMLQSQSHPFLFGQSLLPPPCSSSSEPISPNFHAPPPPIFSSLVTNNNSSIDQFSTVPAAGAEPSSPTTLPFFSSLAPSDPMFMATLLRRWLLLNNNNNNNGQQQQNGCFLPPSNSSSAETSSQQQQQLFATALAAAAAAQQQQQHQQIQNFPPPLPQFSSHNNNNNGDFSLPFQLAMRLQAAAAAAAAAAETSAAEEVRVDDQNEDNNNNKNLEAISPAASSSSSPTTSHRSFHPYDGPLNNISMAKQIVVVGRSFATADVTDVVGTDSDKKVNINENETSPPSSPSLMRDSQAEHGNACRRKMPSSCVTQVNAHRIAIPVPKQHVGVFNL